jgi:hypothetical protein
MLVICLSSFINESYRKNKVKKTIVLLCILLTLMTAGCKAEPSVYRTIYGNLHTYYEMSDGTWMCEEYRYRYRLEISGRMHSAVKDSTFVYLSNLKEISFDRAWKASGLSSNTEDYFSPGEAVLVEMD